MGLTISFNRFPAISEMKIAEPKPRGIPIIKAPKVTQKEPIIKVQAPNSGSAFVGYQLLPKINSVKETLLKSGKPSLNKPYIKAKSTTIVNSAAV